MGVRHGKNVMWQILRILLPYLCQFRLFLLQIQVCLSPGPFHNLSWWVLVQQVVSLGWSVKVNAVVVGLSHKLSHLNGEKLVTFHSVISPTMLLLRESVSESESLLYLWAEKRDLGCCAIFSFQGFLLHRRGERTAAKILLQLCYITRNIRQLLWSDHSSL